jgi:hypothetical protein
VATARPYPAWTGPEPVDAGRQCFIIDRRPIPDEDFAAAVQELLDLLDNSAGDAPRRGGRRLRDLAG